MNALDVILVVAVIAGALLGLKSGIVRLLSFGAGIAIGLLQASIFYKKTAAWLQETTDLDSLLCLVLGFVIVFIIVAAIVNIVGAIMRGVLKAVLLGWLDRRLGAAFAAIIAMGVVVLGVNISEEASPGNEITSKTSQEESLLYKQCAEVTFLVIEEAKKIDEEKEQHTEEAGEQGL